MTRPPKPIEPPRWLPLLEKRVASLRTAHDWLYSLTKLQIRLERYDIIPADDKKARAVVTPNRNVGQVGGPYDYFLVNLSAPDGVLQSEFKNWLEEQRRKVPALIKNRGPNVMAATFGSTEFTNWRDLKIIEYGSLLVWRKWSSVQKNKKVPEATIGLWTTRLGSNDRKRTLDCLKKVLGSLPALAAQAGAELSR